MILFLFKIRHLAFLPLFPITNNFLNYQLNNSLFSPSQFIECHKIVKKARHKFRKPKVTSQSRLFCSTYNPNQKSIELTMM